jgi:hypothetical protein
MHAPTLMYDRKKVIGKNLRFQNEYIYINDYWQIIENIGNIIYSNIREELSSYRLHLDGDGAQNTNEILKEEII